MIMFWQIAVGWEYRIIQPVATNQCCLWTRTTRSATQIVILYALKQVDSVLDSFLRCVTQTDRMIASATFISINTVIYNIIAVNSLVFEPFIAGFLCDQII